MAIRFFFESDGEVIQLPVNPEQLQIKGQGDNEFLHIVKLGDISILKEPKLQEIQIKCFFPAMAHRYYPYVLTPDYFQPPPFYIDFFENIREARIPCRFIVSDTVVNKMVSIESFHYTYEAGDEDVFYELNVKEYRRGRAWSLKGKSSLGSFKEEKKSYTKYSTSDAKIQDARKGKDGQRDSKKIVRPDTNRKGYESFQNREKEFSVGDEVIVNGLYWFDPYGGEPHETFLDFKGQISHIIQNPHWDQKYPYHVANQEGNFRGWVSFEQLSKRQ